MTMLDGRQRAGDVLLNTSGDAGYPGWARSFAAHFQRLRSEDSLPIDEALDRWCSYYGKLNPQEAAELAAGVWPNGCGSGHPPR